MNTPTKMTPERTAYARKRIERLTARIDAAEGVIERAKMNPMTGALSKTTQHQRQNDILARARWLKELSDAGL